MKTTDFLDAVRARHGLTSDYQLARFLGVRQGTVSSYRTGRSMMDEAMCLKIAGVLELDPGHVLAAIAAERAKPEEVKTAWSKVAAQLAKVGCFAALLPILQSQDMRQPSPAAGPDYTYQPKPPRRLARWAAGGLSAWCRALGLSLALAGQAHAGDWTVYDTAREAGFTALLAADCLQTRYGIEHPGQFREGNRLVAGGSDEPSKGRLNNICIGTALGHYGISRWFSPDSRKLWQSFTIFLEVYTVANNKAAGLKIEFPL